MIIIVEGEGCWLLDHINENGYSQTYTYPLSMNVEEVKWAWMEKALSGTMTTAASWFEDDFGSD